MKILMINSVCGIRSTGRICTDLAVELEKQGHEVKIAYGRELVPEQFQRFAIRIGSDIDVKLHGIKARLFDAMGFGSKKITKRFIEWVKSYNPDVIHLHNIHGYYINIEVLFDYLKTCGKKIIWTLHDCWTFTGHSAYCDAINCTRWKTGCFECPQRKIYPKSLTDNAQRNWQRKQEIFSGVPNLVIVTPSNWLKGLVQESFLTEYSVVVFHNGINTNVFKPTISNFREKYGLEKKIIILGVAAIWEKRKGLEDFVKLSKLLEDKYCIILVGLNDEQRKHLPKNIISINIQQNPEDLVKLYSVADVFVNPTYEDNYPTVNLEAIACGTPVITYNTGGSPESIGEFGEVVDKGNIKELVSSINSLLHRQPIDYPKKSSFDKKIATEKYMALYES